ncbi:MAG: hypothetical protein GY765_15020, partial [bacterium]|nr:hypothetical protein [bacterium]
NASFFESSVYSSKEDIIEDRPTMKEILARQVLNTSYFKRLIISCDKKIRTNPNRAACGVLGKGHIADALFKELNHGQSWTRLRKNVNPCKSCVYHALCPPISNYEHVLDKNNLCHVK